jgi:hypothetical protein
MFTEKLNRKQDGSVYVVEEELLIIAGKYEGYLAHDNIASGTIKAFTGPSLTGEEIINIVVSIPGDMPWKKYIKLFTDVEKVYVTYETPGDTVEAEDINLLQETAETIRVDFEQYKTVGYINGGTF